MHGVSLARSASAHSLSWLVTHNPLYLVSAALTATGARLYLVGPDNAAGDVQLILMTLCVLQVYEWAVTAVLIALYRSGRSPEDVPVIMVVGAIFWTAPMAATIELCALDPLSGLGLAAGAAIIAMAEFRTAIRMLWVRVSIRAQGVCAACLVLLTAIGPLMHIGDEGASRNELLFYAAWWLLALLPLGLLGCAYGARVACEHYVNPGTRIAANLVFAGVVIVMTAVNFVGVGHAFLCHTRWFYASPLMIGFATLLFHGLPRHTRAAHVLCGAVSILPAVAIGLALRGFAPEFPLDRMPTPLHEPVAGVALAAAGAYLAGFIWRGHFNFVHAFFASVAIAGLAVYKSVSLGDIPWSELGNDDALRRGLITIGLYATAGYLLVCAIIRRSRATMLVCLLVHLAATVTLTWRRIDSDQVLIFLCFGWSVLAAMHVATNRPRLAHRLVAISFIALATAYWGADAAHRVEAGIHASAMVGLLLIIGIVWTWTRYVTVSMSLAGTFGGTYVIAEGASGPAPAAALVSAGGFAALALAATLSWHKARLVKAIQKMTCTGPDSIVTTHHPSPQKGSLRDKCSITPISPPESFPPDC